MQLPCKHCSTPSTQIYVVVANFDGVRQKCLKSTLYFDCFSWVSVYNVNKLTHKKVSNIGHRTVKEVLLKLNTPDTRSSRENIWIGNPKTNHSTQWTIKYFESSLSFYWFKTNYSCSCLVTGDVAKLDLLAREVVTDLANVAAVAATWSEGHPTNQNRLRIKVPKYWHKKKHIVQCLSNKVHGRSIWLKW